MQRQKNRPDEQRNDDKISPFVEPKGVKNQPDNKCYRNSVQKWHKLINGLCINEIYKEESDRGNKPHQQHTHTGDNAFVS